MTVSQTFHLLCAGTIYLVLCPALSYHQSHVAGRLHFCSFLAITLGLLRRGCYNEGITCYTNGLFLSIGYTGSGGRCNLVAGVIIGGLYVSFCGLIILIWRVL